MMVPRRYVMFLRKNEIGSLKKMQPQERLTANVGGARI